MTLAPKNALFRMRDSLKPMAVLAVLWLAGPAYANGLQTYSSEKEAIMSCGGQGIVWVDMSSGQYLFKGSKYYGKGKNAAFACQPAVDAAGGRPAKQ